MSLSFGNGLLLWGTLLFAVPLIIHLLNRRRYRVRPWAAQEFLLAAFQRTRRRLTLESLLLLLARCLLVAVLAFALARPFVPAGSALSMFTPRQRNVVLVMDTSFSMERARGSGDSAFERARVQARRVLDGLDENRGDEVAIVTLSGAPRVLQPPTGQIARARDVLDRMAPEARAADLVRSLNFLDENLLSPSTSHQEVWIFTDLQRTTFHPGPVAGGLAALTEGEAGPAAAFRRAAANDCEFALVDVGDPTPASNHSVIELSIRPRNAVKSEVTALVATVRNHSNRERTGVAGTFVVNGRRDQARQVRFDLPPSGTATVETTTIFAAGGSATVEFSLEEDELPPDDRRFLAFPVLEAVNVLVVDGAPHPDAALAETTTLVDMLNPHADPETGGTIYRVRRIDDRRFNLRAENPADYDLIVLANVARLDPKVAAELDDAIRAGRGLLIFLGDQVDPTAWNERLHRADGDGLLPARLLDVRGVRDARSDAVFHPRADHLEHPILKLFQDPLLQQNLTSRWVRAFYRVEVTPKDTATQVVMRLDDDARAPSPLVLEKPVGHGRVMLWTTTADADWAGFAEAPLAFLPLLQETAAYLTLPDLSRSNLEIGGRIRRTTRGVPGSVVVTSPLGERTVIADPPREREYGEFVLRPFEATHVPGFYTLELTYPLSGGATDRGGRELESYAVNVDPREGDLARVEPAAFDALYPGLALRFVEDVVPQGDAAPAAREGELARALLWAVLGLLLVEFLLAHLFGRRSAGGAT